MVVTPQAVLFVLASSLLSVVAHVYLYRRLFRDTGRHLGWRRAGVVMMTVLCAALVSSRVLVRLVPSEVTLAVAQLGWFWMGVALYLFLGMLCLGGVRLLAARLGRARERPASPPASAPTSEERRVFLARATAGAALAATGSLATYGTWRAYEPPVLNEVAVRLRGLPRALEGFSIVQLSDVHVGPLIQRRFLDAVVAQCNALRPDLVAVTGDLVDGPVKDLSSAVAALTNLRSRHGTFFVTGNHEYYAGDVQWAEALEQMGVHVLRNRHVRIGQPGSCFDLAGVDDWSAQKLGYSRGYDLASALAGREDPERPAVLLAHQPRGWRMAAQAGIGLQLSGHTHGGQFFPFNLAVSAIWEHPAGLFREEGSHLYVSRGTGFWGPPLRVAAPPEIVKVVLLPG